LIHRLCSREIWDPGRIQEESEYLVVHERVKVAGNAEVWGCPNALKETQHVLVEDKRKAVCWLGNEMTVWEGSRMGIEGQISQKHHASY
jgi:hypothetical protein